MEFIKSKTKSSKQIKVAYLTTFMIIGMLFTIDVSSFYYFIWADERAAVEIHVAGRQRMLSQRIALIAANFNNPKTVAERDPSEWLLGCANLMQRSHQAIFRRNLEELNSVINEGISCKYKPLSKSGFVDNLSGDISLYSKYDTNILNDKIDRFIKLAESIAQSHGYDYDSINKITDLAINEIPYELNQLVFVLQKDAEQKSVILEVFVSGIWFFMIIMMILVSRFIFKPLIANIEKTEEDFNLQIAEAEYMSSLMEEHSKELVALTEQAEYDRMIAEKMAQTDQLTGLFNRRVFHDRGREAMAVGERYHEPVSIIMCDIDKFKSVNDTLGHDVGDMVLEKFAELMSTGLRKAGDLVARYGGEEFVIMLPRTDINGAEILAERLRTDFADYKFRIAGSEYQFTSSFGVACNTIAQTNDLEVLVKHADQQLYRAKETGRNRVCAEK